MPIITLVNEGRTIEVTEGSNLRKVLLKHGVNPYVGKDKLLNCLGNGLCGTCRVEVVDGKGAPPMTAMEEAALPGLRAGLPRIAPLAGGLPSLRGAAGAGTGPVGSPQGDPLRPFLLAAVRAMTPLAVPARPCPTRIKRVRRAAPRIVRIFVDAPPVRS